MATTQKRPARTTKVSKEKLTDEYGHLQPQAPELEKAVLGALMIEKDAYSLVSEILKPESFYEHRHQLIYAAITDLAIQQKPIDLLTRTYRIPRTYHRTEVPCQRAYHIHKQYSEKGFRRD